MRTLLNVLALTAAVAMVSAALPASAQVVDPQLFGDGHLPSYRPGETDRFFLKSGIYAALTVPPKDPACQKILATLLVAYADALPYLHRKDQNFYVDPALLQALDRTVSTKDFPARAFLAAMVRRTLIDKKVPPAWITTAEDLRAKLQAPIPIARMKLFATSVQPIDSFLFNMPALLDRYAREVKLAPSVAIDSADNKFRDKYMDRDIAWGGLILHDIAKEAPPPPPKKKGRHKKVVEPPPEPEPLHTWAIVGFPVGKPKPMLPGIPGGGEIPQIEIRVRLKDDPIADLSRFVRGQRVLVKGHLWDMGNNMGYLEVRDAELFADVDWATWPGMASPQDVAACPIAVNDLSAYGFRPPPAHGQPDAFSHTHE